MGLLLLLSLHILHGRLQHFHCAISVSGVSIAFFFSSSCVFSTLLAFVLLRVAGYAVCCLVLAL
jgi:hypothetical protein